jgi:exosome complex component CSL4
MIQTKRVLPGEEVAVEEEYLASEGTYNEDGIIYASQVGDLELNLEEMTAGVRSPNPPNVLRNGDVVFGIIADTRSTMATVDVVAKDGSERGVGGETYGTIHVSKISPGYTEDVTKELRKGDIIRARVTQIKPSLQLTTKEEHLGVVKARCWKCRGEMVRRGKMLLCEECDRKATRKIADDYGEVIF